MASHRPSHRMRRACMNVRAAASGTRAPNTAAACGPCTAIAPILEGLEGEYKGRLQIVKVDVDLNKDVPGKYGIRGIPTLMVFKDGQLAATKVGAMSKAQLTAFIDQQL